MRKASYARFYASAAAKMRYSLFWDVTQLSLVVTNVAENRRFHLQGSSLHMGLTRVHETPLSNCQSMLHNIPGELPSPTSVLFEKVKIKLGN